MSDYDYDQIKDLLFKWVINDAVKFLKNKDKIEVSKNNSDALIIDLTFDYCLAQIIVSNPIFAPYQFLSFEALEFNCDNIQQMKNSKMIYFFYDNYKTSKEDIINQLEIGLKYCSNYIPNLLEKIYLNKIGNLTINHFRDIHPNDLDKVSTKFLYNTKFKCINISSQYLVLTDDITTIRVLPKSFYIL